MRVVRLVCNQWREPDLARPCELPDRLPGGKRIYVDPWLRQPEVPGEEKEPERVDLIAVTHGHSDHVGNTVELSRVQAARRRDGRAARLAPGNRAGDRTMPRPEQGRHGRDRRDQVHVHGREPLELEHGGDVHRRAGRDRDRVEDGTALYFAGDTNVFGDMQLIGRLYSPTWPCCRSAATSRWTRARRRSRSSCSASKRCVPCHYGTFPLLKGTPDELRELAPPGVEIARSSPGRRSRFEGALVRRDGQAACPRSRSRASSALPEDALVLDDVSDAAALRRPTSEGTPIVVRAARPRRSWRRSRGPRSRASSSRPTKRELLELDLPELTYG